jgi:hypothetical protein
VDFFHRDDSGVETPYPSAIVGWSVTDGGGGLLAGGEATTTSAGWISFVPVLPIGYEGTIDVAASAATSAGTIRASRPRSSGSEAGVFGVVPGSASGTITFTGLDSGGVMLTTPVVTGAFSAPSLVSARGRFEARFEGPSGETFSRRFTKDASDYQLLMVPSRPLRPDLADSSVADPPRLVSQNESFATTDTVTNVGTDTAGALVHAVLPVARPELDVPLSAMSASRTQRCALCERAGGGCRRLARTERDRKQARCVLR